jgi:methylenetetrahydrofolate dehydrogenase (NADP+) / methenyltetrahydrofolate cyclohydrolase
MILLNGRKIADRILGDLKKEVKSRQLKIKLAVIWVGDDKSSGIYIREKKEAAKKIGAGFELYHFKENISSADLKKEIMKIVKNTENSGIIIQLPLPQGKEAKKFLNLIPGKKDIDVLSEASFEKFAKGKLEIMPPTICGVANLLKEYRIPLKGKNVVIVGAGRLVGKPLAAWMRMQKIEFAVLDKSTEDLTYFTKKADVLISGVGKKNLIKGGMVREGAVVIDVGGDVDFKAVSKTAGFITPVFGGVGPLTVACLLLNLVKINK